MLFPHLTGLSRTAVEGGGGGSRPAARGQRHCRGPGAAGDAAAAAATGPAPDGGAHPAAAHRPPAPHPRHGHTLAGALGLEVRICMSYQRTWWRLSSWICTTLLGRTGTVTAVAIMAGGWAPDAVLVSLCYCRSYTPAILNPETAAHGADGGGAAGGVRGGARGAAPHGPGRRDGSKLYRAASPDAPRGQGCESPPSRFAGSAHSSAMAHVSESLVAAAGRGAWMPSGRAAQERCLESWNPLLTVTCCWLCSRRSCAPMPGCGGRATCRQRMPS